LKVFDILHASALYWNEYVPLRLPGLRQMLQLGVNQDEERALREINFIVSERPTQIAAAQWVTLEITLDRLEECDDLEDISKATQHLGRILPTGDRLIDPRWVKPLAWLNNACQSAANYRFRAPREIQARRDALDEMIANLRRVHAERAFEDEELNKRLSVIVERWLELARQEREKVEQSPIVTGSIDNPYVCGPALKANNTLFVGRRDLMNQLEQALNKGDHRPCFFLTGERRMGKTSTINQLSNLLSPRYLTIILDLQARGISASATIFLAEIAGAISKTMDQHGLRVHNTLEHDFLQQEASRGNEAQAYYYFGKWFSEIEVILEKNNRTVLLAFDEFEKLEEASNARSLDLHLLLDWFRFVMQNHPRLALLFSGVKSLSEIEAQSKLIWSGYLVNVRTLKVSVLRPTDAENLITEPVSHYPGGKIFDREVVDEIIHITGCHPFLIQAICSELIDILNADHRQHVCLPDVDVAAKEVLQGWWDTYFRDLWERTPTEQRLCLSVLRHPGAATLEAVAQETGLDSRIVTQALNKLKQRDLVFSKDYDYSIVAPMFEKWVELNQE
ncbi:MAG TPA: AAA family ATPase, partial [Ktedonosporobacter sp.]|nr:AAA family ATPase [Ktedonosporobacter sp.]